MICDKVWHKRESFCVEKLKKGSETWKLVEIFSTRDKAVKKMDKLAIEPFQEGTRYRVVHVVETVLCEEIR